jgi:branched-chain amino acid transport system permease protein
MNKLSTLLKSSSSDLLVLLGVVAILSILPVALNPFLLSVATGVLIFALAAIGWNVLSGFAGQFSFGHAAFFGLGAYTVAILLTKYSVSPWLGLVVGGVVGGVFGLVVGWVSFRFGLKGAYFALATFAVAEMLRITFNSLDYLGAGIGITIPLVHGDDWARIQFSDTRELHYWFILGIVAIAVIATIAIKRSRIGSYMFAVREDEDAAAALGINPLKTKLSAISISGFITAVAGGYFTLFFLFIDPDVVFGAVVSIAILLRPIVGGMGTIWGPVIGAAVLSLLGELTRSLVRDPPAFLSFIEGAHGLDQVLFGLILVVMIIRAPDGILGWFRRRNKQDQT